MRGLKTVCQSFPIVVVVGCCFRFTARDSLDLGDEPVDRVEFRSIQLKRNCRSRTDERIPFLREIAFLPRDSGRLRDNRQFWLFALTGRATSVEIQKGRILGLDSAHLGLVMRTRTMRHVIWIPLVTVFLSLVGIDNAEAGLFCGAGKYRNCPASCCEPTGDYCAARACCAPQYKVIRETVWCTQEYTECHTVMDTCCYQVPVSTQRTVYDTCYRDETYTTCRPVYQTCYRDVCHTVRKPVYQTCYRTVCCKIRRPVYNTCYRTVNYTVCKPVYNTCYRDECYTIRKPVYNTCYRTVTCTSYRAETQTCYREVCQTVMKPVTTTSCVPVQCGEWQTVSECVPGPVVDRCVQDPGQFVLDPNSCCTVYKPGCTRIEKVQCPPRTVCKRVWVPKTVMTQQTCTRMVPEVRRCQVPYTVCRRVPVCTTKQVPYTTCSYVCQTCTRRVPYTTCCMTRECRTKQVPYTTCSFVCETVRKQVPYTTCSYVCQTVTRKVPYTTCSHVKECHTRKVPYCVPRTVCETHMVTKTKCTPRTVQVTKTRCVPKTVCRKVPVCSDPCVTAEAPCAAPTACAAPIMK